MKFYLAGSFDVPTLQGFMHLLSQRGHESTFNWINFTPLRPYENFPKETERFALDCLQGIDRSDVFVLISSFNRAGNVEFGYALDKAFRTGKPEMYVIGPHLDHSVFLYPKIVHHKKNLEEVLDEFASRTNQK